ncbi:flavin monoamine oxidase family protein [Psychroserpens sp. NJDZ02]|uniref:flavin monoamine oxidase family protein n=1 Tax=Psychroserpens sp. NJDZ02 TaxID=2570561 RepID=UPI0010A8C7F8|nr:FAD-dependent oxidoreductase [Psychroserpens sp. NJDZ02]QCE42339.1 FAD-dependent oxidoreductase [Psychroserpens sp. NJDZ02]
MTTKNTDILIIGAGLTGLTLAFLLKQTDLKVTIIEANTRIGGRIITKRNTNEAPIDLGATWLIPQQTNVLNLLKTLNIDVFEQFYGATAIYQPDPNKQAQLVSLPTNDSVSYRIKNGTQTLTETLADQLDSTSIQTDTSVISIQLKAEYLEVKTDKQTYHSKHVISTLPPALFNQNISITPELPDAITAVLPNTHTWMHNSIRVGFTYKTPFWKHPQSSGTIYANSGPLQEFYDHSNADQSVYALSGFMSANLHNLDQKQRKQLALDQLQSYYGDQALEYLSYEECVWIDQKHTIKPDNNFLMPQQNNGHPLYQESYLNKRLFIAGAETSPIFSGKMEAAVSSAMHVFNSLKAEIS